MASDLLCLISVATMLAVQNTDARQAAKSPSLWCGIIGYAMDGPQFATRNRIKTHKECHRLCKAEPACESVNYIRRDRLCEMNAASHCNCPGAMVGRREAVYSPKCKNECGCSLREQNRTQSSPPQAHYAFESNVLDSTSFGRHGSAVGHVIYTEGICGSGITLSGTGKVDVHAFRSFNWGHEFSVSAWFKRTSPDGYQGLVNAGYAYYGSWEVRMTNGAHAMEIGGGLVTSSGDSLWAYRVQIPSLNLNQWHHVIMMYNGTQLLFYVDNVLQSGSSGCCHGDIVPKNVPVTIGQAGDGMSTEYFVGSIDEVKIFTRVLCAEEVDTMFRFPCTC